MTTTLAPRVGRTDAAPTTHRSPARVVIGATGTESPRAIGAACARAVAGARAGQTLVVAGDVSVGTTRRLLVGPLRERGFEVGRDVFVAFSAPPADAEALRMVGGCTTRCALAAAAALRDQAPDVIVAGSIEAAELAARLERTFRLTAVA